MSETQRKIAQAFRSLLETKAYSRISIKDICQIAPVSRNTFYYYFDSKETLVEWIVIQDYFKYSFPYMKIKENNISVKSIFTYIYEHRDFYKTIYNIDQGELLKRSLVHAYRISLDEEHVKEHARSVLKDKNKINPELFLRYCNAGVAEVVVYWIGDKMRIPIEKISRDLMLMMTRSMEDIRDYYLY